MEGKCIIISAPSGAGKTTIVKHLLQLNLDLEFSISACNRPMRGDEVNGKDYYFLSTEEFQRKIENNEFLEWEEVYPGQYYGTLRSEIQRIWAKNHVVIFDVDVVGGINLKKIFGEASLSIFIMPPSLEVLEERLQTRKSESPEKISIRVEKARIEINFSPGFDTVVVNDDLPHALRDAEHFVKKFLGKK